ncbi:chromate transporter [Methylocella silvestris]|uniref:Chromate transporter n=1 Tax=Methylocella silvestris TaxID=199596 RepID=A0A2J7TDJ6_METSI|nr:chromate transporter [Methylocella silvestris]PNG24854.1 chromate transporter [Methylocella silvestris]
MTTIDARDHGRPPARRELFMAFFKIGVCGFGGVAGWVRPILVEERDWLSDREFAELHGAASVIPGANTVNLAVMLGDRFQGPAGSIAALCGLLLAPLAILIALASLFEHFGDLAAVKGALSGAAAATAGLVVGNAYKLLRALKSDILALAVAGATFASAGLLHLSLLTTLLLVVPGSLALFAAARRRRR